MSLGLGPLPFHSDILAIGSFGAIKSGVFVSTSAGNSGPFSSTLSNSAPWIMSVAASYTDRTFPAAIKLGNGKIVEGISLNSGNALTKPVPVYYPLSRFCLDGSLNETEVKGKIVVCRKGNFSAYIQSKNVKKSKGAGMILVNPKSGGDELSVQPHIFPTASVGYTAGKFVRRGSPAAIKSALMTTAYNLNNKKSPIADVDSSNSVGPSAYGSGHVDPERAVDPGQIYDIATEDYLKYLCSLNYTSAEIALFAGENFTCPSNGAIRGGELNYPSFAVNFKVGVQNGSLEYERTVTNVGTPTSSYAVQVEVPNGVSVIVKPKILSFNKLGQKQSYKVTIVGKSKTSSYSSFGSLTWVSEKFKVRSPIAVTWK
ncbi:hypothetical protein LWI29_019606 [Acer saccharum]|uniref:Subtilisin-like protease n=1 Tax=Acer saccharum TaxID=4024 RepID=A0AA39VJI2_ACESA|nr:hypothetical protein LWI29_019606 [Acer saccharum]